MNEQPLLVHLLELRTRLVRAILGLMLVFLGLFHWSGDIYHLLAKPLLDALPNGGSMIATEVTATFFVPMKLTMLVAFLISLPNTLYQVWAFVAPGLYSHEKADPATGGGQRAAVLAGDGLCLFPGVPGGFPFLSMMTPSGVSMMTDIDKYLSFVMGMFIAFGVTFEVPIIVIVLVRMGVISIAQLREARPYVIVGAFVVAAVVTPPDVLSQTMLAVPLWLLYEVGIIMAVFMARPGACRERWNSGKMNRKLFHYGAAASLVALILLTLAWGAVAGPGTTGRLVSGAQGGHPAGSADGHSQGAPVYLPVVQHVHSGLLYRGHHAQLGQRPVANPGLVGSGNQRGVLWLRAGFCPYFQAQTGLNCHPEATKQNLPLAGFVFL
jgi:sec-independent protein translocase protein TatC